MYGTEPTNKYEDRIRMYVCIYRVQILVHTFVVFFVAVVVAVVVVPVVVVVSIEASPRSSLPDCVFGCGLRADWRERFCFRRFKNVLLPVSHLLSD